MLRCWDAEMPRCWDAIMRTAMQLQHVPPVPRCMVMSFALTRHHENHTSRRRMLNAIITYPDNIKLGMNEK